MAHSIAITRCKTGGRSKLSPAQVPSIAPINSWPCAPMLNRPARKANATDRPAKIKGVASVSELKIGATMRATEVAS